jgi:excisionase family DNA binding protein
MKTLNLEEAAAFLHMNPETLRERAKAGVIPAAKPGKCWVFLEEDLVAYVRSFYSDTRQAVQVSARQET